MKFCYNCGEEIESSSEFCTYCGTESLSHAQYVGVTDQQAVVPVQPVNQYENVPSNTAYGTKYRIVAALLAIFFGTFGIHKFYMNKTKTGVLRLLFFWRSQWQLKSDWYEWTLER